MRLFDLLDKLMNNENLYAIKDESMFGVRYRKHSGFMICGRDGTYVEHPYTFDKEMTEDGSWLIRSIITPKYKIGDRFILELSHSVKMSVECMIFNSIYNVIGTVSDIKYDGEYIYILSHKDYLEDYRDICDENGVITREISEKELSTYDMVVSQND